jgi:enediyne biosynthesis protein E4
MVRSERGKEKRKGKKAETRRMPMAKPNPPLGSPQLICRVSLGLLLFPLAFSRESSTGLGFSFVNVAREAGLSATTVFGGKAMNKYLLETTGCGTAFLDYDNDGWLDIFLVNGSTLEGFPKGREPINHLYRNLRSGSFEDVTEKAGLRHSGWGQGVCADDYDNDGWTDLFISYWGQNQLYRNRGNGTFEKVTQKAGLLSERPRWGIGCAFLDYDRDSLLDIFVAMLTTSTSISILRLFPNPACAATKE